MTTPVPEVLRRLDRVDGELCTLGTFRRILPTELRADVARAFVGKYVVAVTRHSRRYDGEVVTVASITDGNVSHVLVLKEPGYWPVAISLATIDSIEELTR